MSVHRLSLAAFALGGFLLTGCAGYTVKPPKPETMPRADAPLPLKVGVRLKKTRFEWQGMGPMNTAYMERYHDRGMFRPMWAQADDVGGQFLRALQASSAFARVDQVSGSGSSGDRDLIIEADFSGKYTQDPAGFGKAFMTGFLLFLPAPFLVYDDSYYAAAEIGIYDGSGGLIRKYSERQDVTTSAMLFSAGNAASVSAGIESAAANLAAKLVKLIIDDRAGWKPSAKPAAKEEPVAARKTFRVDDEPASDAGLMKTFRIDDEPEAKPSAAARPRGNTFRIDDEAPAPARAAPVERVIANAEKAHADLVSEEARTDPAPSQAALTSAEEREIDEQVMP